MKGESEEWGRAEGDEGRQEQRRKEGYNVGTDKTREGNEKEGKKGMLKRNRLLEFHILHFKNRTSSYYVLFIEYFLSHFFFL